MSKNLNLSLKEFLGQLTLLLLGLISGMLIAQYNQLDQNIQWIEYISVAFAITSTLYIFSPQKREKPKKKNPSALGFLDGDQVALVEKADKPFKLQLQQKSEFKVPLDKPNGKKVKLTLVKKSDNEDNPDRE